MGVGGIEGLAYRYLHHNHQSIVRAGMIILCLAIGALVAYAIYQEQKKVHKLTCTHMIRLPVPHPSPTPVYTCHRVNSVPHLNQPPPPQTPPQHGDRRAYEDAKKKLERIERERARLASLDLAGSYESLISCPICLEVYRVGEVVVFV